MNYCKNCGNELKDDDLFCEICGIKCDINNAESESAQQNDDSGNTLFCEKCGNKVSTSDSFCFFCGAPVKQIPVQHSEQTVYNSKLDKKNSKREVIIISAVSSVLVILIAVLGIIFLPKLFENNTKADNIESTAPATTAVQPTTGLPTAEQPTTAQPTTQAVTTEPKENYYILPDSDKTKLSYDDIAGLNASELEFARNEIYARHGRKFNTDYIQEYFNLQGWYNGTISPEDFSEDMLSEIEKYNINLIADYEASQNGKTSDENRVSFGEYSFVLPDNWGYDESSEMLYENYNHSLGYSGMLLRIIKTQTHPDNDFYSCAYHLLGEKDGYYYVATEPNGMEFDYQDETATAKYNTAKEQIWQVLSSFEFE